MVGATAGARHSSRTKQRSCSSAGSPSFRCGGPSDFRSKVFRWRSAMRGASPTTIWWFRSGAYQHRVGQTYAITFQPKSQMVLVSAHAPRRSDCLQSVEFGERRPRPLDRTHRIRRSDLSAERAPSREHRNPDPWRFSRRFRGLPTLLTATAGLQDLNAVQCRPATRPRASRRFVAPLPDHHLGAPLSV